MIDPVRLTKYPPFICRLIARVTTTLNGRRSVVPLTTADIARESGLSVRRVIWIAAQSRWDNIPIGEAIAFLKGCHLIDSPVWRWRWYLVRCASRSFAMRHIDALPAADRKRIARNFDAHFSAWIDSMKGTP